MRVRGYRRRRQLAGRHLDLLISAERHETRAGLGTCRGEGDRHPPLLHRHEGRAVCEAHVEAGAEVDRLGGAGDHPEGAPLLVHDLEVRLAGFEHHTPLRIADSGS